MRIDKEQYVKSLTEESLQHILVNTKITDLVFDEVSVILWESLEGFLMTLETMHEHTKSLGLQASWV